MEASRDTLTTRLRDRGFAHADVLLNYSIARETPLEARVTFDLYPGPATRLGPVSVVGNITVSETVVRRMLPFREGDLFSAEELLTGQRNLYNLDIFRRANIVPDSCEAELDIRMTPAFFRAGGADLLQQFLDEKGFDVEMTARNPSPPLDTSPDHPAVKALVAAGAKTVGAPWFCDANWLAAGGIPGAAAGPGSIDQAHTADEWIDLEELERGVAFYRRFLEAF